MFGSSIFEVVIGMGFIYLFLSLICSQINELISSILSMRGKILFEGIRNLLNDPKFTGLAQKLYNHGLVDGISQSAAEPNKANRPPSYMPQNLFSSALLDILITRGAGPSWQAIIDQRKTDVALAKARLDVNPRDLVLQKTLMEAQNALQAVEQHAVKVEEIKDAYNESEWAARQVNGLNDVENLQAAKEKLGRVLILGRLLATNLPDPLGNIEKAVEELPQGHTQQSLLVLIKKTREDPRATDGAKQIAILQENIEQWFDDAMDRVSGWYKRWTQKALIVIAIVLVFLGNVDTFMLAQKLGEDAALRQALISYSTNTFPSNTNDNSSSTTAGENWLQVVRSLGLPFGWIANPEDSNHDGRFPGQCDIRDLNCLAGWAYKLAGLVLSVIALSLGAPFWFDVFKQFGINPRASGPSPDKDSQNS